VASRSSTPSEASMKILHVSDTHLGFSAYSKVDEKTGLNQREVDFYAAFEVFVDEALRIRPDAIIHAGDLFDSVRPTNRALAIAQEQLIRLSDADIPVVVIAGNHSTPRLRETGSVFKLFEPIRTVHPVYRDEVESIEVGDLLVHALPHCDQEQLATQLERMAPNRKMRFNVAVMHAGVSSLQIFRMGEFNELVIPSSELDPAFDYIALGHFHEHCQVTKNASYSGSTERLSFSEVGQDKGFVMVDLEKHRQQFHPLPVRPMVDLGPVDAKRMAGPELREVLASILAGSDIDGKIVRFCIKNVAPEAYRTIDFNWLRSATASAMHFEPHFEVVGETGSVQVGAGTIGPLEKEYVSFLESYALERADRDRIRDEGIAYLQRGVGESD
jgi:DNA repair protein SbcD/Mre11